MPREKLRTVEESISTTEEERLRMQEIADLADVRKFVAFNDMVLTGHEAPSSTATATKRTIYPELTSEVINCGFSLLKTDLGEDDVTPEFIERFCGHLDDSEERHRPDRDDAIGMLKHGAEYVVENTEVDSGALDRIENQGSMFDEDDTPADVREFMPKWLLSSEGTYRETPVSHLRGNHFIEFQVVEDVKDPGTLDRWGVSPGDVVVFLHGDYLLTYYIMMHYTNRKKFREETSSRIDRAKLVTSKVMYHLLHGGLSGFRERWSQHHGRELFTAFDVDSPEGRRLVKALYAGMNFGYANRLLASRCIEEALSNSHSFDVQAELLWDVGHDTIQEEEIDGEDLWIHRKAVGNAVPDEPALITGSYNMKSFLGRSLETADSHLRSYDHGSQRVIEHYESQGGLDGRQEETYMYDRKTGDLENVVTHIDPTPIETVAENLKENGVLSEVAYLRPIANVSE